MGGRELLHRARNVLSGADAPRLDQRLGNPKRVHLDDEVLGKVVRPLEHLLEDLGVPAPHQDRVAHALDVRAQVEAPVAERVRVHVDDADLLCHEHFSPGNN